MTSPPAILMDDCDYDDLEAIRIAAHPSGYAITALRRNCPEPLTACGYDLYGALATADGTVLDADPIGRLLHPRRTAVGGRLVATDSSFLLLWHDTRTRRR